jgi:hypothetical protein
MTWATEMLSKRDWGTRLRRYAQLWAALGYLVLSVLLLAPVLPSFSQAIMGGPIARTDGWQNVWNLWWSARALVQLQNPFVTTLQYYPTGVVLYTQTLSIVNGVLAVWVTWLFGATAAYNFCVLVAFTLAGWGAYLLARHLTHSEGASFIAGVVFGFSPFHLTKLSDGQLELISLQWIPFFVLFLLRAVEQGRRRDILLTALFLDLVALTSWYYGFFCLVFAGLFVLLWLVTSPGHYGQVLKRAVAGLGLGGLLLLPIVIPGLRNAVTQKSDVGLTALHSSDLLDGLLPSTLHPLWGDWAHQVGMRWHPGLSSADSALVAGWNVAFGYVLILLAVVGLVIARRQVWRWGVLLGCTLVLGLGPTLHVAGRDTGVPLPYGLLLQLPGIDIARRPSHFAVLSILLLALLAAYGARWLLERVGARGRPLILALILALIGFEYLPQPLPLLRPDVHPFYAAVAGRDGALLDLPPKIESSDPLLAQMVHGRPIAGGYVARAPLYPFVDNVPGVRNLWHAQPAGPDILNNDPHDGLVALQTYDFRYVVIHWDRLEVDREQMQTVVDETLGDTPPIFADEQVSFYEIPGVPPRPFAYLGEGWYELEQSQDRRWRWIGETAVIHLVNPLTETLSAAVQVEWQSYLRPRAVDTYLDQRRLGQVQVLGFASRPEFRLVLSPGEHVLTFQSAVDAEQVSPYRKLSVACFDVTVDFYR